MNLVLRKATKIFFFSIFFFQIFCLVSSTAFSDDNSQTSRRGAGHRWMSRSEVEETQARSEWDLNEEPLSINEAAKTDSLMGSAIAQ